MNLSFEQFSRINRQRCEAPDGFNHKLDSWSTTDWFLALLGELGEAANIAKKLNRVRDGIPGNKLSKEELQAKLRQELGDTFVYLDLLSQSLGVSIGEAAVEVFNAKSEELNSSIRLAAESSLPPQASREADGPPLFSELTSLLKQWRSAMDEGNCFSPYTKAQHDCADVLEAKLVAYSAKYGMATLAEPTQRGVASAASELQVGSKTVLAHGEERWLVQVLGRLDDVALAGAPQACDKCGERKETLDIDGERLCASCIVYDYQSFDNSIKALEEELKLERAAAAVKGREAT